MEITDALVAYVASLAQLRIEDAQREAVKADLAQMIGYVGQLSEIDTQDVEPMSHAFAIKNVLREDEERESMPREQILQNAPAQKDGCFLVPRTVE